MSGPKGIVFDFGNVLYRVDYGAMARRLAGEREEEFLRSFVGTPLQLAHETGRADLADVLAGLEHCGFAMTRKKFLDAYLGVFSPVPGMRQLLSALAGRIPLGLLSNTSAEHAHLFIERTPESSWFSARAYSFELGRMKPDSYVYRVVADRLGLDSTELAYVDDIEAFARGAEETGMRGVWFRNAATLREQLRDLGFDLGCADRA